MAPPSRSVEYIVGRALNEVKMQTSYLSANNTDFDKAYNSYIDMLIEFDSSGIVTGLSIPNSINDFIGYEVPHSDLVMMLSERIADAFSYALTFRQGTLASEAYNRLLANQTIPSIACNPVPSGYVNFRNYLTDGGCWCDDIHCNGGCSSRCTEGGITTEVGTPILTG